MTVEIPNTPEQLPPGLQQLYRADTQLHIWVGQGFEVNADNYNRLTRVKQDLVAGLQTFMPNVTDVLNRSNSIRSENETNNVWAKQLDFDFLYLFALDGQYRLQTGQGVFSNEERQSLIDYFQNAQLEESHQQWFKTTIQEQLQQERDQQLQRESAKYTSQGARELYQFINKYEPTTASENEVVIKSLQDELRQWIEYEKRDALELKQDKVPLWKMKYPGLSLKEAIAILGEKLDKLKLAESKHKDKVDKAKSPFGGLSPEEIAARAGLMGERKPDDEEGAAFGEGMVDSNWVRSSEAETAELLRMLGIDETVLSNALAIMRQPGSSQAEQSEMKIMLKLPEFCDQYEGFINALFKYVAFGRGEMSKAIGKVADMLGKVGGVDPETQDLENITRTRLKVSLKVERNGVPTTLEGTISVGDFQNYMDNEYAEGMMSSFEAERDAVKLEILQRVLKDKLGLQENDKIIGSNIFNSVGKPKKNGKSPYSREAERTLADNWKDARFLLLGMTGMAEVVTLFHGRSLSMDPAIEGYWPYNFRGVLDIMRYLELFHIGSAGARRVFEILYGSQYGQDLNKIHPLLINSGRYRRKTYKDQEAEVFGVQVGEEIQFFDITDKGRYSSESETVKGRMKDLQWMLRHHNLKDEYHVAEDLIAMHENEFIHPITEKPISIRNEKERLQFLIDYSMYYGDDQGDMASTSVQLGKLEGLEENFGLDFKNRWEGADFTNTIKLGLWRDGKTINEINQFIRTNDCKGVNGLRLAIKGGFNLLEQDNPFHPPTDSTKYYRYLAGIEATVPLYMAIVKAFTAASEDKIQDLGAVKELLEKTAAELQQTLEKMGIEGFPHMSHENKYQIIENIIKGYIDMTKKDKQPVHRYAIEKSHHKNEYRLIVRKADEIRLSDKEMRHYGWTKTRGGKIVSGNHVIYKAEKKKQHDITQREQYSSRMMTVTDFLEVLAVLTDAQILSYEAAHHLYEHYGPSFPNFVEAKKKEIWAAVFKGAAMFVAAAAGNGGGKSGH